MNALRALFGWLADSYIARRILLIFPTLIGILLINFIIVQVAPGGPVDQAIARITGQGVAVTQTIAGAGRPRRHGPGRTQQLRVLARHRP